MLRWLLGLFAGGPLYMRIDRERTVIRNVSTGDVYQCRNIVGVDGSDRVVSVGDPVDPAAIRQVNPFGHPRILIADFVMAEKLAAHAFRQILGPGLFHPSPVVLIHPDFELDGGLTTIEARALREMAEGGGARKVFVHYGNPLTDGRVKAQVDGTVTSVYL